MKIELKITKERLDELTWDDWVLIEDMSESSYKKLKELVSKFVVDEHGNYIDIKEANKVLGALKTSEMKDAFIKFGEAITKTTTEMVPNGNGGS